MKAIHPTLLILLAVLLSSFGLHAQSGDFIAGGIHLKGLLNNKLKIEMMLECNYEQSFFTNTSKNCLDIRGEYYYRTQVLPIRLEGRLCPANATFFLAVKDGATETERFEGKWNTQAKQLTGTWTLIQTNKKMPFTLTATEVGMKETALRGFYGALKDLLATEPDAEGARIDHAEWTAAGGKVTGFSPNWSGGIVHFSPLRLAYYTSYNSTARSSYYEEVYQLLPSNTGIYVAHLSVYSGFEKSYEDGGYMKEGTSSCGFDFQVYQWIDGAAEDVTEKVVPADISRELVEGADEEMCNSHLMSEAVLLPSGEKLYWDGSKFARVSK